MGQKISSKSVDTIDDVMIKDPFCKTYFPKRNGIRFMKDGQEFIFCSKDCRDKFIAFHSRQND
jgi:YHS domain-containing protein